MRDRNILRRRWLAGTAGMGLAGTVGMIGLAALDGPALAREESPKKASDDTLTPAEILSRNNGFLQRVMLIYETAVRRANDGGDIDPRVISIPAETTRDFFHKYNEKAKQEVIYPVFRKAGRMIELVDAAIAQQAEGAKLTDRIVEGAPRIHTKEQRQALADDIGRFIAIYRPLIAREETDLFPTLHALTTPDDYKSLASELLKRQAAAFSQDGFETATKNIADVETKLGTDLAQAPPPAKK
ncbi:MAG: hypothetical protein JOY81_11010 [Alphaproteobacteria bacterium]|nr:hypothetical protein [Alphaproteobacteria bacterium]